MKSKMIFMACLLLLTGAHRSYSQNTDAIWYFGDSAGISFNSGTAVAIGNGQSYSGEAGSTICDNLGNLLFYAGFTINNSFNIWNQQHAVMVNSSLITGMASSQTYTQGVLILPFPGDSLHYYLFTQFAGFSYYHNLKYHTIDMSSDSGRGAVINANISICVNCSLAEKMVGIRHANGRDWWLLGAEWPNTSTGTTGHFIRWLITPMGISQPDTQNIGPCMDAYGQMAVSPMGNKVVTADMNRSLNLYDFDRCTGLLSNCIELGYSPYTYNQFNGFYGCSFSPSGRFMYASRRDSVLQFDVQSQDVLASKVFVARAGHASQYILGQHKLGPDGKIYIPNFNWDDAGVLGWDQWMNVINYPDSAGTACGLAFHSFSLGDRSALWGMPNIPDFNLGAVPGSPCDSLTGVPDPVMQNQVEVYPNPANDYVYIKIPASSSTLEFSIFSSDGSLMLQKQLSQGQNSIQANALPSGFYFYLATSRTGMVQRGKICIIR